MKNITKRLMQIERDALNNTFKILKILEANTYTHARIPHNGTIWTKTRSNRNWAANVNARLKMRRKLQDIRIALTEHKN